MLQCSKSPRWSQDLGGSAAKSPASRGQREETAMDWSPRFDAETKSVCFYVVVRGEHMKSFVTRDWLVSRFGPDVPADSRMVDVYLRHAKAIDAEIVRRIASGRLEPVWLASSLPPLV
jgi:hypothetical protein